MILSIFGILQEEDVTKKLYADYSEFRSAIYNNLVKNNPETSSRKIQQNRVCRLCAIIYPPETKKATKTIASFAEAFGLHGFIINIYFFVYFLFTACLQTGIYISIYRSAGYELSR